MYDKLEITLRNNADHYMTVEGAAGLVHLLTDAADVIEELQRRLEQALYMPLPCWIPVTEQLPKEWQPVYGLIQFYNDKEPPAQQVLWYLGNGRWRETWRGDIIVEGDVTHWMPLLEPPKEEK